MVASEQGGFFGVWGAARILSYSIVGTLRHCVPASVGYEFGKISPCFSEKCKNFAFNSHLGTGHSLSQTVLLVSQIFIAVTDT
jgi:hypothetical protein